MTFPRTTLWTALLTVAWLTVSAVPAAAQDTLVRAKDFYASAAYEEALLVLERLHANPVPAEAAEVAAYRVFCLVALGRNIEARAAAETIVRANPLYHPSDADTSPRIRAFFEDVRRSLLPDIIRQGYADAKALFDRKEMAAADAEFDRVILLLDEVGSAQPGFADMRTLAASFRDLARLASAPPPAPPAAPAPEPEPEVAAPAGPRVYGAPDLDITPPVAITRTLPPWRPANPVEARRRFTGMVELIVDEQGNVLSAKILQSVNAGYDPILLEAAMSWKYRPARDRAGTAVRYRVLSDVSLQASIGR